MKLEKAQEKVQKLIQDRAWGSHGQTEEVLQEMLFRLDEPEFHDLNESGEPNDADLNWLYEECLMDLRDGAFTDVTNLFKE